MIGDLERYSRALSSCEANARAATSIEIGMLWSTIARSYRFLLEREYRLISGTEPAPQERLGGL
jgi:hypothetical protein